MEKADKIRWHGEINAKTIIINNQYGDVVLRYGNDENKVEYLGVIQHLESDGRLYATHNETKNVLYISTGRKSKNKNSKPNQLARIDLTVFVPKGIDLQVQTDRGKINTKGLKSNIIARSISGNISIRKHQGIIQTNNETGKTNVVLIARDYKETQNFESVYGAINVTISNHSNIKVKMSTSSNITSDFSLEMFKHRNKEPNKTAIIKNNNANSMVVMSSKRGDLSLKEYMEFLD